MLYSRFMLNGMLFSGCFDVSQFESKFSEVWDWIQEEQK